MAAIFDKIQIKKPKTSVFDLSHERKMSMNMGDLVPCMVQEVIPGDKFKVNMEHLIRFQPLLAPMMHRVNVYTHFFFVPNRLVWNEWEKFITNTPLDAQGTVPVFPRVQYQTNGPEQNALALFQPGSLMDYMGVPVNNINPVDPAQFVFSELPFRAYQLIYNEYYRDQNLISPNPIKLSSGITSNLSEIWDLCRLQKRAWEKDYFTSALPFAQKGTALSLPVDSYTGKMEINSNNSTPEFITTSGTPASVGLKTSTTGQLVNDGGTLFMKFGSETGLYGDLSDVTAGTVNELRQAFSIQKWLEKNARGGTRYVEQILAHFGVRSDDARLQRPEYLGGGKTPVVVSEVLQNSASTESSPQGNMAGHGISVGNTNSFTASFKEHGFIIGIMSVLPRTSYQNGLPRHLQKFDKFEYFWPDLANIGEQEVKMSELYYDFEDVTDNNATFGYQPRYAEYRFAPDSVHGDFTTNLDFWHMGRKFLQTNKPMLNENFVSADPTKRIFAVDDPSSHSLLVQTYSNVTAIRPLPKFGTPLGV